MSDARAIPTVVWLDEPQIELVRDVASIVGLRIVGAGSPTRGQSGGLASALRADEIDDLRHALRHAKADLFWIASPGDFALAGGSDDAQALRDACERGSRIATLEPIPASPLDLASGGWTERIGSGTLVDAVRFCPLSRLAAPFRQASEVLDAFGPVRTVVLDTWCAPHEGSLGARLFSAMELVHWLLGEPESIDAAHVAPRAAGASETLRGLHGDLTANLRFEGGRAASIAASDRAGRWNRTTTLIGESGRLRVYDDGFEWIGARGERVDHARDSDRVRGSEPGVAHSTAAIADSLVRLLDPVVPAPPPIGHAAVLTMCHAALLSARTRHPESPATIKRMMGAGGVAG